MAAFSRADFPRAQAFAAKHGFRLITPGAPQHSALAELIADVSADVREQCAAKCDDMATGKDRTAPERAIGALLAKRIRSGKRP